MSRSKMTQLESSPALLIIDMQNCFCHPSGSFHKVGLPTAHQAAVIPAIRRLADLFHKCDLPVYYTRMEFEEDFSDAGLMIDSLPGLKEIGALVRGTWDAQIVDNLQPSSHDVIVPKKRHSAFFDTNLNQLLVAQNINQIIATGVATNVCDESTVREAWAHGYYALTVGDATASLSEEEQKASLTNLQHFGGTLSVRELEVELERRMAATSS